MARWSAGRNTSQASLSPLNPRFRFRGWLGKRIIAISGQSVPALTMCKILRSSQE